MDGSAEKAIARKPRVLHVTTAHRADDVRIFERECRSLATTGKYDVYLAAAGCIPADSGVKFVPLVPPPTSRVGRFSRAPRRVLNLSRAVAADLWHFHDPELLPVALKLAGSGIPVVWDAHEDYVAQFAEDGGKSWVPAPARGIVRGGMRAMLSAVDKRAAGVVAATPRIASRYRNPRTFVVGNEARLEDFEACTPDFAVRRILFTGSPRPGHLFDQIVEAIRATPDVTLVVAGRPPDERTWADAKARLGSRVEHLGWLDRRGVANAMSDSSLGLVTYANVSTNADNSPNKVFEFCAAGLPFIASPNGSNVRFVQEGGGGFLADGFSADALAKTISAALSDQERWRAVSQSGRAWASKTGSWKTSEERLLSLYSQILGE